MASLGLSFTTDQWNAVHNQHNDKGIGSMGVDLSKTTPETFGEKPAKALFICCNTYTTKGYELGEGPMNDAIQIAEHMAGLGYKLFFLHNPKACLFVPWLGYFFENTTEALLVYYTGHGASVADDDGDEDDGFDEAFVFDDKRYVRDDDLLECIQQRKTNDDLRVVLLSDCCHSGSIYDLQSERRKNLPPNVVSLSAARDSQTAKQTSIGGTDQGIFTHYFLKLLSDDPAMTPKRMKKKIDEHISKYDQHFTMAVTRQILVRTPIFGDK